MLSWKAIAVAVPLAAGSGWGFAASSAEIARLRTDLATVEVAGADARAAVGRLEPHAVDRQLETFDRRRAVAAELARARRNRVLAALGLVASLLVAAGSVLVSGVAAPDGDDAEPRDPDR